MNYGKQNYPRRSMLLKIKQRKRKSDGMKKDYDFKRERATRYSTQNVCKQTSTREKLAGGGWRKALTYFLTLALNGFETVFRIALPNKRF